MTHPTTYTDDYFREAERHDLGPLAQATAEAKARMAEHGVKGPKQCGCGDAKWRDVDEDGDARCLRCGGWCE